MDASQRAATADTGHPRTLNGAPTAGTGSAPWGFLLPTHDKVDHAVYSAALTLGGYALLSGLASLEFRAGKPFLSHWWRVALSAVASLLLGVGKEWLDSTGSGRAEALDLVADAVGVSLAVGALVVGRF